MQTKTIKILNNLQPDGLKSSDGNFKPRKKREPVSVGRVATYAVLGLYTLWIMAPFMIILISSFTPRSEFETATSFIWWPKEFSLEGYQRLFTNKTFNVGGIPMLLRGFLNTMWITLIPLASGLLQSLLVAYCYWQGKFPFKNSLFMFTVTLMFIPLGAFGFVGYMFYDNLGWTEGWQSVLPLIVPGLFASASTVFFLRPYLDGISGEIIEAARIDGMNFWQIFFTIVLPLSKPALIAQFIFGFVGGYNNYAGALMYLIDEKSLWTLQLAVQQSVNYMTEGDFDYAFQCATALLSMLPLIIVYLICQKFFIEGISFGGGKE